VIIYNKKMKKEFNHYRQLLEQPGEFEQKSKDYLELIDKYYADDIFQIENSSEPIRGKERLREMEHKNLDGVHSVETKLNNVVMDEENGLVWGEMVVRFDSKKSGLLRLEEAFFQKWVKEKIQSQRFFYSKMINEKQ